MATTKTWEYFYEIYEGIPRQGPGDRESTLRALKLVPPLGHRQRILDVGCGSGTQTLDLAGATEARIVAVDNHAPFVLQLAKRASARGLATGIAAQVADMNDLPFPDGSFDLVWSEGAIFVIGFSQGLAKWRRLLKPGGHLVVSEYCWFRDDPPADLREVHTQGCPDVGDVADRRAAVAASGYELLADFVLPEIGWWENYYVPLAECLERFRAAHAADLAALEVAARSQHEIDLYRRYAGWFGYVFFVMRLKD